MLKKFLFAFIVLVENFNFQTKGQSFLLSGSYSDQANTITCLEASPDGKLLIAGDANGYISFRDGETGRMISTVQAASASIESINFNSTGRLMVIASHDGEINIYDFIQNKFIQSLYSPEYSGMRFALFSIADGFIYFNGQGRLYKTRSDLSQAPIKIFQFDSTIVEAVITNDRAALIFACDHTLHVINTRTDIETQTFTTSWSPIEQLELTADNKLATWRRDGTISLHQYDLNQLNPIPLASFKAGNCSNIAFSNSGNLMVTGNTGNWARIWNPYEKTILQELYGHQTAVTNFAFSKSDDILFTSDTDHGLKVWKKQQDLLSNPVAETPLKPENLPPTIDSGSIQKPFIITDAAGNAMPVIELDNDNIPRLVGGRTVNRTTDIIINQPELEISVYDNSTLDGDIMSLTFQNQWILKHYPVTKKKNKIMLQLIPDVNNYMVLFADNLGKTPPNTAVISFNQNGQEKVFRLESDLSSCSAINFIYRKK